MLETWDELEKRQEIEREVWKRLESVRSRGMQEYYHTNKISTLRGIAIHVAAKHGLTMEQMMSRRRTRRFTEARFEAYHMSYQGGRSLTQIGDFYGFDHTSILNGIRRHEELSK